MYMHVEEYGREQLGGTVASAGNTAREYRPTRPERLGSVAVPLQPTRRLEPNSERHIIRNLHRHVLRSAEHPQRVRLARLDGPEHPAVASLSDRSSLVSRSHAAGSNRLGMTRESRE
jgi:hypothetical protein